MRKKEQEESDSLWLITYNAVGRIDRVAGVAVIAGVVTSLTALAVSFDTLGVLTSHTRGRLAPMHLSQHRLELFIDV